MRNFAICGTEVAGREAGNPSLGTLTIDGLPITCGVVDRAPAEWAPDSAEHARCVLVRVRAFSCNFRDKAYILWMASAGTAKRTRVIGSEFVADVVAVGREVTRVVPGDRVVADNSYPRECPQGYNRGVPTNGASREYMILREEKVAPVPPAMPDAVAASFSIGAQTTYSMLEKGGVGPGSTVLVTSARSNTSLFAIAAACRRGARVYATTSSTRDADALRALGLADLFVVDTRKQTLAEHPALAAAALGVGGFECVIDPYFDLHLFQALQVMAWGGRYVTCGLQEQYQVVTAGPPRVPRFDYREALTVALLKNISIIGNCIGLTRHLETALADYLGGGLPVAVDSVFGGDDAVGFLDRTYNDPTRFGKVVFAYA